MVNGNMAAGEGNLGWAKGRQTLGHCAGFCGKLLRGAVALWSPQAYCATNGKLAGFGMPARLLSPNKESEP
jgi:hypothetical protein